MVEVCLSDGGLDVEFVCSGLEANPTLRVATWGGLEADVAVLDEPMSSARVERLNAVNGIPGVLLGEDGVGEDEEGDFFAQRRGSDVGAVEDVCEYVFWASEMLHRRTPFLLVLGSREQLYRFLWLLSRNKPSFSAKIGQNS